MLPRASLLVCLVAAAVAAPNLFGDFVLDDQRAIVASGCVTGELGWAELFTRNYWCQDLRAVSVDAWRPWPVLWWRLAWGSGGGASLPFHLLSLLLHMACALSLVACARSQGMQDRFAVAAGLVFAASPIHIDAVGWAVGQADLWAALFGLGSLLFLRRGRLAVALLSFGLACVCKESALMLLPALWWLEPQGDPESAKPRAKRRRRLAFLFLALVYLLVRQTALGEITAVHSTFTGNPLLSMGWAERAMYAPEIWGRYVMTTILGAPLSADWSHDALGIRGGVDPLYSLAGLAAAGGVGIILWRGWGNSAIRSCGLLLAAYALLLGQLLTPLPITYAERLFYLPSAGLIWLALLAVESGWGSWSARLTRGVSAVLVIALVVHVGLAMRQAYAWTSEDRIIEATLGSAPDSARARVWAGWRAAEAGDLDAVEEHASAAAEIQPGWPVPHALRAFAFDRMGQPQLAAQSCGLALSLDPADGQSTSVCIQFLIAHGKVDDARQIYAQHAAARGGVADPDVPVP